MLGAASQVWRWPRRLVTTAGPYASGIFVWENGLRVLDALGVGAPILAGAWQAPRYEVRDHLDDLVAEKSFGAALGTRMITADGVNSEVRESLDLREKRYGAGDFGAIRLLTSRAKDEPDNVIHYLSPPNQQIRRMLYVPCDADNLYVAFTIAEADTAGKSIPAGTRYFRLCSGRSSGQFM